MAMQKMYTIPEIADNTGLSRATLYDYIEKGKLKSVKFGRVWRVAEDELGRFLNEGVPHNKKEKQA